MEEKEDLGSYSEGGTVDAVSVPSTGLQDILVRSFMYSDMGFDDRGNRSFKMVIKTQTLKDLQDLQAALVEASSPNRLPTTEGVTQADYGQQIIDDMIYAAAQSLDYPSVYMGGPSQASMRRAKMCIKAALEAAANRPLPPPPGQNT